MLTAKIITAAFLFLVAVIQLLMEFCWHDKRTRNYRYARNCFIVTVLLGTGLNGVLLAVDEAKNERNAEADATSRTKFENQSLGALTPNIWVFLYKDSKLVCPQIDQTFPGNSWGLQMLSQIGFGPKPLLCIIVFNTNSFPIYDIQITLLEETPNIDNTMPVTEKFPKPSWDISILKPHGQNICVFSTSTNLYTKGFQFLVETRKGETKHQIALAYISNHWEYASSVMDMLEGKTISWYYSAHFPRDTNGDPSIPIVTQVRATTNARPDLKVEPSPEKLQR